MLAALAHPSALLLPLLSALLVSAGFALAAVNWFRFRRTPEVMTDRMTLPGLLVFYGFAAAIFSDPDAVAQSLSHLR